MPYYRRRYPRRGGFRKMPYRRYKKSNTAWYNKKYSIGDVASHAWSASKYLLRMVNVEQKKFDFGETSQAIPVGGDVVHLTAIAQGDNDGTRSGNSVLGQRLLINGNISINAAATNTNVRILVIRDKQQVGDGTPAITDVLDASYADYLVAPLNNDTVGRFDILYDRRFDLHVDTEKATKLFKISRSVNKHVRYNGSAGTDIQKGGLYMIACSSEATNTPTYTYYSRFTYTDN